MMTAAELDANVRILYRASQDAWIQGNDTEAERLCNLAHKTRRDGNKMLDGDVSLKGEPFTSTED